MIFPRILCWTTDFPQINPFINVGFLFLFYPFSEVPFHILAFFNYCRIKFTFSVLVGLQIAIVHSIAVFHP